MPLPITSLKMEGKKRAADDDDEATAMEDDTTLAALEKTSKKKFLAQVDGFLFPRRQPSSP